MSFRVVYTTRSNLELQQATLWWAEHRDAGQAAKWLDAFQAAIAQLAQHPDRFAVARENELFEKTLREIHFGLGRKPSHRAVYEIREDKVIVHAIRHVAQEDLSPDDL